MYEVVLMLCIEVWNIQVIFWIIWYVYSYPVTASDVCTSSMCRYRIFEGYSHVRSFGANNMRMTNTRRQLLPHKPHELCSLTNMYGHEICHNSVKTWSQTKKVSAKLWRGFHRLASQLQPFDYSVLWDIIITASNICISKFNCWYKTCNCCFELLKTLRNMATTYVDQ